MANSTAEAKSIFSKNSLYASLKSINRGVQDTRPPSSQALYNFIRTVSSQNNSRTLKASEISSKLQQRGLTLLGIGYNASITSSKPRRCCKNRRNRLDRLLTQAKTTPVQPLNDDFVGQLNEKWNAYIMAMITAPNASETNLRRRLAAQNCEWVGARVVSPVNGILVHTQNWVVAGQQGCVSLGHQREITIAIPVSAETTYYIRLTNADCDETQTT